MNKYLRAIWLVLAAAAVLIHPSVTAADGDSEGGAPTILLVHGLFASADLNWSLAIPELASAYRVVAPDLRGHGDGIRTRRFDAPRVAPQGGSP